MKNDIRITVVIETNNNLQLPHAMQVGKVKQVDSDQGSKLTRFRAYLPLVVSLMFNLIGFIKDKLN